jgi:very-short-patch-repair endonuclease
VRRNLTHRPRSRRGKGEYSGSPLRAGEGSGDRSLHARNIVVGQKVDPVKLQRAKELRQEMTEAERLLWKRLRRNQLRPFHFRRQQVIDGLIVDFYCHAAGLVLEVDGGVHMAQGEYDAQRDLILSRRGLRVLRIRNDEVVRNLDGVVARRRGARGEVSVI